MNTKESLSNLTLEQLYFKTWSEIIKIEIISLLPNNCHDSLFQYVDIRLFTERKTKNISLCYLEENNIGLKYCRHWQDKIMNCEIKPIMYSFKFTCNDPRFSKHQCEIEFRAITDCGRNKIIKVTNNVNHNLCPLKLTLNTMREWSRRYKHIILDMILSSTNLPHSIINFCILSYIFVDPLDVKELTERIEYNKNVKLHEDFAHLLYDNVNKNKNN